MGSTVSQNAAVIEPQALFELGGFGAACAEARSFVLPNVLSRLSSLARTQPANGVVQTQLFVPEGVES